MADEDDITDREAMFIAIGILTAALLPLNDLIQDHDGKRTAGECGKAFDAIVDTCKKVEKVVNKGMEKVKKLAFKK